MFRRLALSFTVLTTFAAQAQVTDSTPVIEAAGRSITKYEFEQMMSGDARMAGAVGRPGALRGIGNDFGKAFALEAEALNRGLDKLPSVQLRVRNFQMQLLANELLVTLRRGYLKDEAAMNALYETRKQAYMEPRVRQILIRTKGSEVALRKGRPDLTVEQARAKGEALLAKLGKGADFAALAKAESDDIGSAANGGDIGFVRKGSTAAAFEQVAFDQTIGDVSGLIQTEYGFHIIRVEERRPMPPAAVKAVLANELAHRDLDAIIASGFKLNTAYFGQPTGQ